MCFCKCAIPIAAKPLFLLALLHLFSFCTPLAPQIPFSDASNPRLQNETQSKKPGVQNSLQLDLKFTFLFLLLLMSEVFFPRKWSGIQTNWTNDYSVCTEDCTTFSVLCAQPSEGPSQVATIANT